MLAFDELCHRVAQHGNFNDHHQRIRKCQQHTATIEYRVLKSTNENVRGNDSDRRLNLDGFCFQRSPIDEEAEYNVQIWQFDRLRNSKTSVAETLINAVDILSLAKRTLKTSLMWV